LINLSYTLNNNYSFFEDEFRNIKENKSEEHSVPITNPKAKKRLNSGNNGFYQRNAKKEFNLNATIKNSGNKIRKLQNTFDL